MKTTTVASTLALTLGLTGVAFAQSASTGCLPKAQQAQGGPSAIYDSSRPQLAMGPPSALYESSRPRLTQGEQTGVKMAQNASGTQDPCR